MTCIKFFEIVSTFCSFLFQGTKTSFQTPTSLSTRCRTFSVRAKA